MTLVAAMSALLGVAGPCFAHTSARFALVIGNNRPPPGAQVAQLRYADDDAVVLQQLLIEAGVETRLLVSPDQETRELWPNLKSTTASRAALKHTIEELAARVQVAAAAGAQTELLVFYSGHGDIDDANMGYVVLDDGRLTRESLYALLTRIGAADNHVIIDACNAYFLAFERGPGGRRSPYQGSSPARPVPSQLANTGFVLSSTRGGVSHEWERYRAGVVSYEVRSALRGAADADHDHRISYAELGAFIGRANQRLPPNVRPSVLVKPPREDAAAPLLTWQRPPAVALDAADWGHVYVETSRAERLVDVHPAPDASTELWLPLERPLFVRRNDESAECIVEDVQYAVLDAANARKSTHVPKGAVSRAFERELFSLPFGPEQVVRYLDPPGPAQKPPPPIAAPALAESHSARDTYLWVGVAGTAVFAAAGAISRVDRAARVRRQR